MERIIERFLLPLFVVMSILYAVTSFSADNELKKIYHHTTSDSLHLELATLSLYCAQDFHIQEIKKKGSLVHGNGVFTCMSFFLPGVMVRSDECKAMVKRATMNNDMYTVVVQEVKKPDVGLMIELCFDPKKITVSYDTFDSIGLQKGLVFRLHNKELLSQLEQKNNQPLLRTLWHTGNPRIVIDPGHGGVDSGAIGHGALQEKNVCLAIGTYVADLLRDKGCDVFLTRNTDTTVFLDERTRYANSMCADMCISIHANYSYSPRACGIETFFFTPTLCCERGSFLTEKEKINVASCLVQKSENAQKIAQSIQSSVCQSVRKYHECAIDRKVKTSVSQILLGSQIPTVLIEVGFVSHPREAQLLSGEKYQRCIAQGIAQGILSTITFV